ncbi:type 1 periplasmic binding fold superfamily protein [uncultured Marixanthomonas sp.]|uniref:type 1 periplasmic binding fold superfamily protein n=1 Tax=uncultured Marixanthomonas sp. TaxID=757245 RepID=UPI0030DD8BAF|tara:strand:+ start:29097 stop:29654 length:558 start_codon:yes stop_codon:yes gene_type:complete
MKNLKSVSILFFASLLFIACSSDDENPEPVNEEEIITTVTVTLTPDDGGTPVTLVTRDLDGDGPNEPVITVSGNLNANTSYNGDIILLNETEDPAENITEEVVEEAEEHQFFYTIAGGLNASTEYSNYDSDDNPLGTKFILSAGDASAGTLTFTLRHEPKKPNDGTLGDAGGETDIEATFNVTVE